MTSKASKWRRHVDRWRASGKSAAAYSAEHGLKVWSLRYWSQRIEEPARPDTPQGLAVRTVRLAQVRPKQTQRPGRADDAVQLSAGAFSLQVSPGFDRDALRDVLSVVLELVEGRR
jgi:hypothetical protein